MVSFSLTVGGRSIDRTSPPTSPGQGQLGVRPRRALVGAVGGALFATLIPWVLPKFKRPYIAAWAVSSLGLGGAIFIDQIVMQEGTLGSAVAWALGTSVGLAILVPLIWFRIHMWDHFFAAQQRREQAERNARYRPKDFGD